MLLMLLMQCARVTLEEYELSQGGVHTYAQNIAKLKECFQSTSSRENSNIIFNKRVQKIGESEEVFMLELVKLYKSANPEHNAQVSLLAIKRKFLEGAAGGWRMLPKFP
jgi:hypothetical protein